MHPMCCKAGLGSFNVIGFDRSTENVQQHECMCAQVCPVMARLKSRLIRSFFSRLSIKRPKLKISISPIVKLNFHAFSDLNHLSGALQTPVCFRCSLFLLDDWCMSCGLCHNDEGSEAVHALLPSHQVSSTVSNECLIMLMGV